MKVARAFQGEGHQHLRWTENWCQGWESWAPSIEAMNKYEEVISTNPNQAAKTWLCKVAFPKTLPVILNRT